MMNLITDIYCDSGADINFLKIYPFLAFHQCPYDPNNRPKILKKKLAIPSALAWENAHTTWEESNYKFEDCVKSEIYDSIVKIIGKENGEDILHIDSAYKTGCKMFLTSDKRNIFSNKLALEEICKFKIFFHGDKSQIVEYIEELRSSLNSL